MADNTPRPGDDLMVEQEAELDAMFGGMLAAIRTTLAAAPPGEPISHLHAARAMRTVAQQRAKLFGATEDTADLSPVGLLVQHYARQAAALPAREALGFVRRQLGEEGYRRLVQAANERRAADAPTQDAG